MQKNEHLLRFPRSLPNDVYDFVLYYPRKFPGVVNFFDDLVKEIHMNPEFFRKRCFELQKELFAGFEKIKKDYENCENKDVAFLVNIDQRLHKLFCYRFWIVNYLLCDGPLHNHYVGKVKDFAEKIADWEDIEDKEKVTLQMERDLLQSDYVDLYLGQALQGIKVFNFLNSLKDIREELTHLNDLIKLNDDKQCYPLIEKILNFVESIPFNEKKDFEEILADQKLTAQVRGDNIMIYNSIIRAIKFKESSLLIKDRHESMKGRLEKAFALAKENLTAEEYETFLTVTQMARNFVEAKDIFGDIDPFLIPFWFKNIIAEVKKQVCPHVDIDIMHSSMFKDLVWYLPDELKIKVMTPDLSSFEIDSL